MPTGPDIPESFVLRKCEFFTDVQLWPLASKLNYAQWLTNFTEEEKQYAIHLLNGFLYFNELMMERMLYASFQDLSRLFRSNREPAYVARQNWKRFLDHVLIVGVSGENPHPADSGFKFMRMARQVLGLPESQILTTEQALTILVKGENRPIVFVDDFVGSGDQFLRTWRREHEIRGAGTVSFSKLPHISRGIEVYYCPLVCTRYGADRIGSVASEIVINPAYLLSDKYSAMNPESVLWPEEFRDQGQEFIRDVSDRAAIPNWKGFHGLSMALAFEHSIPDATLPLFYWAKNGWKPLMKRT